MPSASFETDVERRQFVRRLTWITLAITVFGGVGSFLGGSHQGAGILLATTLVFVGIEVANRLGAPFAWLGGALTGVVWVVVTALCVLVGGGLAAPAVVVLPVVPLLAAFLSGVTASRVWTSICAATALVMFVQGDAIPPIALRPDALLGIRVLAVLGGVMLVGASALAYATANRRSARLLEAARREAEEARAAAEAAREEAELANRAKSSFLATMSHEIRTPLTAVVGVAEVLRDSVPGPQQAHQLALLDGAGRTLLGLVDDVLDLSRIEAGQLDLEWVPVNLAEVVQDLGGILQVRARDQGVRLTTRYDGPTGVVGDPLRLRQILLNLVGNAVKFTKEGEVELRCTVGRAPQEGRLAVELTVRDTGVGIPLAQQSAIFQPFMQAERGTARRFGGSGLGLSIVTRLVGLMDGHISLESEVGVGTTVTVRLELDASEPPQAPAAREGTRPTGTLRVLLVEDNPVNQHVVRTMLERCACAVEVAGNGRQAVDLVVREGRPFDLVLMDCQMPELDGFEATREIREAGSTLPIVALTANATPADKAACIDAGMDDFASKPIRLGALRELLNRHGTPETAGPRRVLAG